MFKKSLLWCACLFLAISIFPDSAAINSRLLAGELEKILEMKVYRSASCGCCKEWVAHIRKNGFSANEFIVQDVRVHKNRIGVPGSLRSCHTATIGDYAIEGHVPAADIRRMLREKPAISGLAVPGMPVGTPGMEMGDRKDAFDVVSFDKKGKTGVFKQYKN